MRYQLIPVVLLLAVTACARDPNGGALDEAHLDRAHIEAVFETVQRMSNSGCLNGFSFATRAVPTMVVDWA